MTKTDLNPILGVEGFVHIMKSVHQQKISVPIIAIGGITEKDVAHLKQTGLHGIAVSGEISLATNKHAVVKQMKDTLMRTVKIERT
jgi:thiamine-phosphate pyrophosphorylase